MVIFNNIVCTESINKFKIEELANMQIHYKSWFEYGYMETYRDVIFEVYKYC